MAYLKYFPDHLNMISIILVEVEIRIRFALETRDFITIISKLNKKIYTLLNECQQINKMTKM